MTATVERPTMKQRRPNLSNAVGDFRAAIRGLVDEHVTHIDSITYRAPGLYDQLSQAIPGEQGNGGHASRSMPPLWCDAVDVLADIDIAVASWLPFHQESTHTRLKCLIRLRKWKQHDIGFLESSTRRLRGWTHRINELLTPEAVKHISAPCPVCQATTVYRTDSGGDRVRVPALQLITDRGATCVACHTHWEPKYYLFLCELLEFDLPEGVLE